MASLKCFKSIAVTNLKIQKKRITADYILELENGDEVHHKLIHTYEEDIITDKTREFASLTVSTPLVNYGLFADRIVFDVPLTRQGKEFLEDTTRITAYDIFVNRIVRNTGFLRDEYIPDPEMVKPEDAEPRVQLVFTRTANPGSTEHGLDEKKCAVMSSGGKESLLSYGILREVGCEVYPCFFNESGHHWFTALTAYRYFKEHEPRTLRVWSNVDRLYTFIGEHMKILKRNAYKKDKAEIYPIRLFFFEHYVFSFLPLLYKRNIANVILGNEYDDPSRTSYLFKGIKHYNAVYDQSQEFDKYMTNWFKRSGLGFKQWSAVRPLSGLIVERILADRYPELFKLQRSCHSVHLENGKVLPCGTCSKCNGIILFLLANGIDPRIIGYKTQHIETVFDRINRGSIRLDPDELEHSLYLLTLRSGKQIEGSQKHEHVEMIQFDELNSHPDNIPAAVREKIYQIYEAYTKGYAFLTPKGWVTISREEALRGALNNEK
ncbi:MAG: hypothetical protein F7B60_00415 [Desulfurococcales archaeon]|nr:hypothetical protein [Desulfurococcales archaeon]